MLISRNKICRPLTFVLTLVLMISPAWAEKPRQDEAGKYHRKYHHSKKNKESRGKKAQSARQIHGGHQDRYLMQRFFNDYHRYVIGSYYRKEFKHNPCPPGLAKKNNSCYPPGQLKRWHIGSPLPHDVVYEEVPAAVMRQIGYAPAGYRFVRVASDFLMIAIGTGLVVDAITDLNVMH